MYEQYSNYGGSRLEQMHRALLETGRENEYLKQQLLSAREKFDRQNQAIANLQAALKRQEQYIKKQQDELFRKNAELKALHERLENLEDNSVREKQLKELLGNQSRELEDRDNKIEQLSAALDEAKSNRISVEDFELLQKDFQNSKKRLQEEIEKARENETIEIIKPVINIFDCFSMAMAAADSKDGLSSIEQGMRIIDNEIMRAMAELGLKRHNSVGKKFDPKLHEAVGHEASEEIPEGFVIRQWRCGYSVNGNLLRPAAVVVSKGKE